MEEIYDIVIVGGGISGLYCLYKILKLNISLNVLLIEKESRLGGRIFTVFDDYNNPIFEKGAYRIDLKHYRIIGLLNELNIDFELLTLETFTDPKLVFENENYIKDKYFFIKNGFNTIIYKLYENIPSKYISLQSKVVDIFGNNGEYKINYVNQGHNINIKSKKVILACPPQIFKKWNITYDLCNIINSVKEYSLNKIIIQTVSQATFKNINNYQLYLSNDLNRVISSIYQNNWSTISYSAENLANYWNELYINDPTKYKNKITGLTKSFVNKSLNIIDTQNIYWECGNHTWCVENTQEMYLESINPKHNLYIIGEAFSLNQGWCEGALQTADSCISFLLRHEMSSINKNFRIDYTDYIDIIYDQENTSSCTSNCLATIFGFILKQQGLYYYPLSRLYIYYNTRILMNQTDLDEGSVPEKALEAIKIYGICPENMWNFTKENVFKKPPVDCYEFSKKFPIDVDYFTFYISEQKCWYQTCKYYLCNGILLLCNIERYLEQSVNIDGYIDSIPKEITNIWYHGIVMVGLDLQEKCAIFINSHKTDFAVFKMSFDQIKNLNPIQDTIYVIKGKFLNNKIFDLEKLNAVTSFLKHSYLTNTNLYIDPIPIKKPLLYNKVIDHIIIGDGITGKYLAFLLQKEFPNESILIITNDILSSENISTSVNSSPIFNYELPYTALTYFDYPCAPIPKLLKEFQIPEANELFSTLEYNENFQHIPIVKELDELLFKDFKFSFINNDNFLDTLLELFSKTETTKIFSDTYLTVNGFNKDNIEFIKSQIRRKIPTFSLYYFIAKLFATSLINTRCINSVIKPILKNLSKDFVHFNLGDFLEINDNLHIILYDMFVYKINNNSVCIRKENFNKALSSSIEIKCKNVYNCNLNAERNKSELFAVDLYNINLYLFYDSTIKFFKTFKHDKWGLVNYINSNVINCKDVSVEFFNEIQINTPIVIKSNVLFPICLTENLTILFNKHNPLPDFKIKYLMVFSYPYNIKYQITSDKKSFLDRLLYQLNIFGFDHYFNTGYSIMPLNIEGSLNMVDIYMQNLPVIGILHESDNDFLEINEISGVKKIFFNYDTTSEILDKYLNQVQLIIVSGSKKNNFKENIEFLQNLLYKIKSINNKGIYLPVFFICYGFELLLVSEFPDVKLTKIKAHKIILDLNLVGAGVLSSFDNKNTFHDHIFGIKFDNPSSEYKIIHTYVFNKQTYIASIENKLYPIYALQWHPFNSKTKSYLQNIKILKYLFSYK